MYFKLLTCHHYSIKVIDFSHGLAIYERCPRAVEPLWVEVRSYITFLPSLSTIRGFFIDQVYFQGAGHNDVELYNQYLERLKTFVSTELTN